MKKEEALDYLKRIKENYHWCCEEDALEMAIKAIEQEPCEDVISRQAVINNSWELTYPDSTSERVVSVKDIEQLPSVNPQKNIINNGTMNITL